MATEILADKSANHQPIVLPKKKQKELKEMLMHLIERKIDESYMDMSNLVIFSFKYFVCSDKWSKMHPERRGDFVEAYNKLLFTLETIDKATSKVDFDLMTTLTVKNKKEAVTS